MITDTTDTPEVDPKSLADAAQLCEDNERVESILSHVSYWNGFPVVLRKFQVFSGPCVGGCIVLGCHLRAIVVDGITSAFCAAHHAGTRAGC